MLESDWNWPFARSLVDALRQATPADPFVGNWYHATAEAQSALLAQSQLALIRGDARGTLSPIERLPGHPSVEMLDRDPWNYYRLAAGRDWESLYRLVIER